MNNSGSTYIGFSKNYKNDILVANVKEEYVEIVDVNGKVLGSRNLYYEKISVSKDKSFLSKLLDFLKFWWLND